MNLVIHKGRRVDNAYINYKEAGKLASLFFFAITNRIINIQNTNEYNPK